MERAGAARPYRDFMRMAYVPEIEEERKREDPA
jgi:hypothetical protein